MKYNVGEVRLAFGEATRRKIEAYFKDNPFAMQSECAAALEMTPQTISRHFRALRAERLAKSATEALSVERESV